MAYTDGGCVGNPGPGGWGVHVEYPDGRVIELGGAELQTTNNRMELRAAIEAARAVSGWPAATIIADSQYVLQGHHGVGHGLEAERLEDGGRAAGLESGSLGGA